MGRYNFIRYGTEWSGENCIRFESFRKSVNTKNEWKRGFSSAIYELNSNNLHQAEISRMNYSTLWNIKEKTMALTFAREVIFGIQRVD